MQAGNFQREHKGGFSPETDCNKKNNLALFNRISAHYFLWGTQVRGVAELNWTPV